jgi:RNA polymerase sigma-70 factor (ECF subfamily)
MFLQGPSRMAEPPLTRVTLLNRLKDGADADAWREFVHLYGPVVYGFARKRGLQDADAADLMQEVLRSVARNAEKMEYDPSRGTFRGWLYTVTRNKIYNFLNGQRNRPRGTGDSGAQERLDAVPARPEERDDDWDLEYQRQLSAKAMERVRHEFQANTWKAFWGTAVEGRAAQEVGGELKMTPGAVYVAKSRVLARLREEVQRLQAEAEAW